MYLKTPHIVSYCVTYLRTHRRVRVEETRLPSFDYFLDESDPDILVLRRQDGSFVAAFSAQGATKEGIIQVAEEDYLRVAQEVTHAHVAAHGRR